MPPRVSPPSPASPRHALRGVACMLLLGWLSKPLPARVDQLPKPGSPTAPYLPAMGPTALRFLPPPQPLPPAPTAKPAAEGPPLPTTPPEAAKPDVVMSAPKPEPAKVQITPAATPAPAQSPVARILPDETRPRVHPEDFLPYFQFPNSGDAPPAPPSSATYRQQ